MNFTFETEIFYLRQLTDGLRWICLVVLHLLSYLHPSYGSSLYSSMQTEVPHEKTLSREFKMRRFLCVGSLLAACFLISSPSFLADGVHSFAERGDSDFDNSHFADANSASVERHTAFFESKTSGSNEDHTNWLGDVDDDHGKAWGSHKGVNHHKGDSWWNFGDQDNGTTDGDSGDTGDTGNTGAPTASVPEPSVLALLSTALAAFLLKSLRKATV
jgi:hypothetical protein